MILSCFVFFLSFVVFIVLIIVLMMMMIFLEHDIGGDKDDR